MKGAPSTAIRVSAILTVLCIGAQAQDASRHPGQKQIGKVKPEVEPALIFMNSAGTTLKGNRLVLTGVAPNSITFADRPVRAAGRALTAHLLEEWPLVQQLRQGPAERNSIGVRQGRIHDEGHCRHLEESEDGRKPTHL